MSFQFTTSTCHHHGTIKPVTSNTGKHAGKWTCKIKGPIVTAQGLNVKTLFSAPYIGAAKAAIAKYLKITVSELKVVDEAVHSSGPGGGTPSPQRQMYQSTPQSNNGRMMEFDDNDDEFASFDLHAVVSSAKKQPPPLQKKDAVQSSPHISQEMSPSNPYQRQQDSSHNNHAAKGSSSILCNVKSSTKPPQYPNTSGGKLKSSNCAWPNYNTANASLSESTKEWEECDELKKEAKGLRQEKESLLKEVSLIKQKKEELEKEAHNAHNKNQCLREESKLAEQERDKVKGQSCAVRDEHDQLKKEMKMAMQQKEALEKEAQNLLGQNQRLKNEFKLAEQQRDKLQSQTRAVSEECIQLEKDLTETKQHQEELEKEAQTLQGENQRLRNESMLAEQQREKLRGQTRAVSEEYDQVKKDLESVKQQKDKSEKEAQVANNKKLQYEKEAKTAKEALDSRKSELDQKPSAVESNSSNAAEPPTKKRKAGKQAKSSGTVTKSLKVLELKEEAVARGIDPKSLMKVNKTQLQNELMIGSTRITKTDAWAQVLCIRDKLEKERRQAQEKEASLQQEEARRLEEIDRKEAEEEEKRQAELRVIKKDKREAEINSQVEKHTHHFPAVHACKLAITEDLLFHGDSRSYNARCSGCRGFRYAHYTCEKCDFDICQECFKEKNMTPKEKKALAKEKAAIEKQRRKEQAEMRRLQEKEEEERRKKWDPKTHFKPKIIEPSDKNMDPDGNKKKGFTVWSSDGYGNDGWHSYEGPPDKEFDSTFATKKDANARARYMFHWKNPWGHEPEIIMEEEEVEESMNDGLVTYVVSPPDSSTWTVSVVPDAAFSYMENSTHKSHGYDTEYPTAGDYGYGTG